MKFKVLSINKQLEHNLIDNSDFKSAPAFSDYDVLIIDPKGLSNFWKGQIHETPSGIPQADTLRDKGYGNRMLSLFNRRKSEIEQLLKISQGIVICYLRRHEPSLRLIRYRKTIRYYEDLNIYSWLPKFNFSLEDGETFRKGIFPDQINFKYREGSEISFIEQSHPFSKYFYAYKEQIKFECIVETEGSLEAFLPVISKNKVQETISCEVPIEGGKIIFIPPNLAETTKKEAGVLLDCIEGIFEHVAESPPPPWIEKYSLPNENKNKAKIEELDKRISEFQKEKQKLEEEQINILKFKGLLFAKGKRTLEPLVRDAFKLMEFNVLDSDQYEEEYDLYIKEGNLTIIGEIEGTDSSLIDVDKYRQLLDYVEAELDKGIKCKGILIGNAYRYKDPAERQNQFSNHAIKRCENQGFCRITTYQLYELVKKMLSGIEKSDLKKLREDIINCKTEFIFVKQKNSS